MTFSTGDRVTIGPESIFKSATINDGDTVRVNDIIQRSCPSFSVGSRVTVDPIGIRRSACGSTVPNLYVSDEGNNRIIGLDCSGGSLSWINNSGTYNSPVAICTLAGAYHANQVSFYHTTYRLEMAVLDSSMTQLSNVGFDPAYGSRKTSLGWFAESALVVRHYRAESNYSGGTYGYLWAFPGLLNYHPNKNFKLLCQDENGHMYTSDGVDWITKFQANTNCTIEVAYQTVTGPINGICTDGVYVYYTTDTHLITLFCSDLSFVSSVLFDYPVFGLCCDSKYFYVADTANDQIVMLRKSNLSIVSTIGSSGSGNGQFSGPTGICIYQPL